MKIRHWFILAAAVSAGLAAEPLFADDQPGAPANSSPPPPGQSHPARKKKPASPDKTAAARKKSSAASEPMKAAPLAPGPAVVTQKSVNVRAQAAINSEVVARLKQGDHVTVVEEVTLKKPKTDEPVKWAKVSLPTNATAWVNTTFIDAANKTVVPKKLNVRSGPGENFTVVARLAKGTAVKEIEAKGEWTKIEAPADSYGFIAAHLLASEPAAAPPPPVIVAAVEPPRAPPTETKLPPPLAPAVPADPVVPAVVAPAQPTLTPTPPAAPPDVAATPAAPTPPPEEILVKRVISREGVVKRSVSIQAPTYFALESLDTGKTINYLYSPSTNLVLKDFRGKRIVVTGEEMLDERWPNTPVINVETLQAVP